MDTGDVRTPPRGAAEPGGSIIETTAVETHDPEQVQRIEMARLAGDYIPALPRRRVAIAGAIRALRGRYRYVRRPARPTDTGVPAEWLCRHRDHHADSGSAREMLVASHVPAASVAADNVTVINYDT
jgi:hypothetical protein